MATTPASTTTATTPTTPLVRETHTVAAAAGHTLAVDVIGAGAAHAHARRPCVMWIHGGGLIFGSRTMSPRPHLAQALVDLGFVVASVDHRLAPETKLDAIVDDVRALWAWLHDAGPGLFGADPRNVFAAGASAGAYLALLAGCDFTPTPRAVASLWGFGDITAPWEAEPSAHYLRAPAVSRADAHASLRLGAVPTPDGHDRSLFYLYCRQQGRWLPEVTGHTWPEDAAWLRRYCPLHLAGRDFPPTVLVHGRDDVDVPASESDALAERLRRHGVAHRYHALPGVGHGFAGAASELVQAVERDVAAFLRAHVVDDDTGADVDVDVRRPS